MTDSPRDVLRDNDDRKVCYVGTHRVRSPEETLARIAPIYSRVGITRVADVTWLDDIGIPVYQAVRPNARILSVSQGKGLTPALAKVSAAMESIELWHAEELEDGPVLERVGDVASTLGYPLDAVISNAGSFVNPGLKIRWTPAHFLGREGATLVPDAILRLDARVVRAWAPFASFEASSNGLASGNTVKEATLHAMCEVVERDALFAHRRSEVEHIVDPETVTGSASQLLETFARAGTNVIVKLLPSRCDIPCFLTFIWSDMFPVYFYGSGCHLDRDVALCRALTEAAQSRATGIAGSRDDMAATSYRMARSFAGAPARRPEPTSVDARSGGGARTTRSVAFADAPSIQNADLAADLDLLVTRVMRATGYDPLFVDHTRDDIGIPVVRVVAPGLDYEPH